jgi:hypothetical protein
MLTASASCHPHHLLCFIYIPIDKDSSLSWYYCTMFVKTPQIGKSNIKKSKIKDKEVTLPPRGVMVNMVDFIWPKV